MPRKRWRTPPRQPLALIAAHRAIGELETDTGRFDAARAHLDAALALAEGCAATAFAYQHGLA